MRSKTSDDGFKLDIEPEETESVYKEEINDLRLEKLSQRVTLISILIPIMIVVILAVTYLDIKKRVIKTQYTGTSSVQSLAKELDSRFSSLSLRQAELESRLDAITKSNAALQIALDKNSGKLRKMNKSMATAKALAKLNSKFDKEIKGVRSSLNSLENQYATLSTRINEELDAVAKQIPGLSERLNSMDQSVKALETGKISKEDLDLAIKLEALKTKQALQIKIDDLASKLEKIQTKINVLNSKLKRLQGTAATRSGKPEKSPSKPKPSKPKQDSEPAKKIIEQDIKQ